LDFFLERFQTIHKPNQQLSLDEAMIPWRGAAHKKEVKLGTSASSA